ncbi:YafY family transcriptional regulator [Pseudomonas caspiana]|nr:YafY family transcriptional regulator [Pseudomonas caspiana]
MSRSERLLNLLQVLRRHRLPVSGQILASEMGGSIRTLYRDIASLKAQGAAIEGEVGIGYIMSPGLMLPPLMLGSAELDALVLGMRLVLDRGDPDLVQAASNTLAKISAVLPINMRRELEGYALLVGSGMEAPKDKIKPSSLRDGIRLERKLEIAYQLSTGMLSKRVVWPFALAFLSRHMCWCELRGAFRNFRTDRINEATLLSDCYHKHKQALLKEWRNSELVSGKTILSETDTGSN